MKTLRRCCVTVRRGVERHRDAGLVVAQWIVGEDVALEHPGSCARAAADVAELAAAAFAGQVGGIAQGDEEITTP
jgi:hypothetical protein